MNAFIELYEIEISAIKAQIETKLGFMPTSSLPEDIQAEVYAHGWGRPDLIPSWEEELLNPQLTYVNCFDGREYPIKRAWIEARQDELRRFIEHQTGRRQIPLSLDRELDRLIQLQLDYEEDCWEDCWDEIGLPDDDPTDVPDEWFERG